ncbi:MAG TPA: chemotaxis protein CheA [Allosphingosinicella sp.]|nr:chemotaxis protein CheA [Allosphingosinicella sp.]
MDELINDFIAETREMLEALSGEIVAWEAAPGDRGRLDEIFRFVHTVKGNSGFFDLPRIGALSHAAEDALASVRSGARTADPALVSAVLAVIDRIGELVEALDSGEDVASEDDAALIAGLQPNADAVLETAAAHHTNPRAARSIRLPVELLDRMMSGISDLVLARNDLARRIREQGAGGEVEGAFERASAIIGELRDEITRTRMQRIDTLFAPLPRMVRDLAGQTGKQVALEIDGADVDIDREMIEMIRDPLTHIVRNAIDHGIETPGQRRRAGKSETGTLGVCARQAGNQILIEICDDGRGIDGAKLVRRAVGAGILSAERADRLTESERTSLVFEAGLSTASEVTDISGRGVGMDVVRANIERIGGLVEIESRKGEGVRLVLRVPLTLTIIPALTVGAGERTYALPRSAIEEIVRVKASNVRVETVGGASVATVRGRRLPLVDLVQLLGVRAGDDGGRSLVILRPAGADLYALSVERIHDHEELVVKPAAPAVMATGLYAGTTIADDGRPVLLLDPPGIAARAGLALGRSESVQAESAVEPRRPGGQAMLFRALSGGRMLAPLAAVQRIHNVPAQAIKRGGGRLHVAVGDELLPLAGCGDEAPDRAISLLRLSDGAREVAYGFDEVLDIVDLPDGLIPAAAAGEIAGVVLVAGEQAELLDLHTLLAAHGAATDAVRPRPLCALPAGDPFMDAIMRPLAEAAGCRVVATGSAESAEAALVIAADEMPAEVPPGARVVRLAAPDQAGDSGAIDRYDREALLAALEGRKRATRKRRNG